jgi:enterochelin esterase-like enzyme
MPVQNTSVIIVENHTLLSEFLEREVIVDCYLPALYSNGELSLLLINDGQDLVTMNFSSILEQLVTIENIAPVLCVGIHCAKDRKNEYGTARILDYKGRGAKAALYNRFIFEELLPFLRKRYLIASFKEKAFAGFSLGGLCALDIVWNHPEEFTKVGVFSGSLWWRSTDQNDEDFNEGTDRIMHAQIREGGYYPWLKFFFEVGTLDEVADRNNNGIIDSIDDTVSLINELTEKGYQPHTDIKYLELKEGRHDVATWAKAIPFFLQWAFPGGV